MIIGNQPKLPGQCFSIGQTLPLACCHHNLQRRIISLIRQKWPKQLKFSRLRLRQSFLIMNDFCYAVFSLLHSLLHRWVEGQVFRFGAWHVVISTQVRHGLGHSCMGPHITQGFHMISHRCSPIQTSCKNQRFYTQAQRSALKAGVRMSSTAFACRCPQRVDTPP